MKPLICTCAGWWTADPMYDPSCNIEEHAILGFEQQGWRTVEIA